MSLKIVSPDEAGAASWRAFVDGCDEAWVDHLLESVERLGSTSRSFAVTEQGKIVGIFVAGVADWFQTRVLTGPGPAIVSGFLRSQVLALMEDRIEQLARSEKLSAMWLALPILAPAWSKTSYWNSSLLELGCACGWPAGDSLRSQVGVHSVIDLSRSETDIIKGLSSGHRGSLKRAQKAGVVSHNHDSEVAWTAFCSLMGQNLERNGGGDYSASYYQYMRNLCAQGYGYLYLAQVGASFIAGLVVRAYKGRAHYLAGGATAEAYRNGALVKLHMDAMSDLAHRGYNHYDLGVYYPGLVGTKMGNIGLFKFRFGGEKWGEISGERIFDERKYFFGSLLVRTQRQRRTYWIQSAINIARRVKRGLAIQKDSK